MTPNRLIRFLTAGTACLALSGCGEANDGPAPADAPPEASTQPQQTAGRLGPATASSIEDPLPAELAEGGSLSERFTRPEDDSRGVGSAGSCAERDTQPSREALKRIRVATLCLMNAQRRAAGVPPLREDRLLTRASTRHSRDMVSRRYFAHESLSGGSVVDRLRAVRYIRSGRAWTVGENLAWGSGALGTPVAIVRAWMNSPGHRRNLLSAQFRSVGLGIVPGTPEARDGATYTTAFGRLG